MCCMRLAGNSTGRKKSPFWHHRTNLSGYICGTEACIDNPKKKLLNTNTSSTCPDNMVNFGLLTAGIGYVGEFGAPCKFQRVSRLGSVTVKNLGGHSKFQGVWTPDPHWLHAQNKLFNNRPVITIILVCYIQERKEQIFGSATQTIIKQKYKSE